MLDPTQRILRQLKFNIADYAVAYYKIHGKSPKGVHLSNMVLRAIDKEPDPFVRSCLRYGFCVTSAKYVEGDCALTLGIHKQTIKKLSSYLA